MPPPLCDIVVARVAPGETFYSLDYRFADGTYDRIKTVASTHCYFPNISHASGRVMYMRKSSNNFLAGDGDEIWSCDLDGSDDVQHLELGDTVLGEAVTNLGHIWWHPTDPTRFVCQLKRGSETRWRFYEYDGGWVPVLHHSDDADVTDIAYDGAGDILFVDGPTGELYRLPHSTSGSWPVVIDGSGIDAILGTWGMVKITAQGGGVLDPAANPSNTRVAHLRIDPFVGLGLEGYWSNWLINPDGSGNVLMIGSGSGNPPSDSAPQAVVGPPQWIDDEWALTTVQLYEGIVPGFPTVEAVHRDGSTRSLVVPNVYGQDYAHLDPVPLGMERTDSPAPPPVFAPQAIPRPIRGFTEDFNRTIVGTLYTPSSTGLSGHLPSSDGRVTLNYTHRAAAGALTHQGAMEATGSAFLFTEWSHVIVANSVGSNTLSGNYGNPDVRPWETSDFLLTLPVTVTIDVQIVAQSGLSTGVLVSLAGDRLLQAYADVQAGTFDPADFGDGSWVFETSITRSTAGDVAVAGSWAEIPGQPDGLGDTVSTSLPSTNVLTGTTQPWVAQIVVTLHADHVTWVINDVLEHEAAFPRTQTDLSAGAFQMYCGYGVGFGGSQHVHVDNLNVGGYGADPRSGERDYYEPILTRRSIADVSPTPPYYPDPLSGAYKPGRVN